MKSGYFLLIKSPAKSPLLEVDVGLMDHTYGMFFWFGSSFATAVHGSRRPTDDSVPPTQSGFSDDNASPLKLLDRI